MIAIDHTGLSMFTELPSGTIFNTGSTEASSKVFDVMYEMSIDIENTLEYLNKNNLVSDLSVINIIGHSTGGGSAHLYCLRNKCETLVLQDPFFVPVISEYGGIVLSSPTYFIYSEDWYRGNEDINEMSEIEVYRNYLTSTYVGSTFENYAKDKKIRLTCDIRFQPNNELRDPRYFGPKPTGTTGAGYGELNSARPLNEDWHVR